MMAHKRRSISLEQCDIMSLASTRGDISITSKEKKAKFGERIQALQQLVSPYGKTDTASVLHEAMGYIKFLQEQVKVLSAPYLQSTPKLERQDLGPYSLSSKGLCLVPISYTIGVASNNGADIWAPIKTGPPDFRGLVSEESSVELHS